MSARRSAATARALARVDAGETRYSAARAEGIALSTIYRAFRRLRPDQAAPAHARSARPRDA